MDNPNLKPDPPSWVEIEVFPAPYVQPKGRWNAAGQWK